METGPHGNLRKVDDGGLGRGLEATIGRPLSGSKDEAAMSPVK
jgi:hypothetical protein